MVDYAAKGLTEEVTVTLTKPDPSVKLGMTLAIYSNDVPHPRIQDMAPGALAAVSGQLKKEDVIISINGFPVKDDVEAARIMGDASSEVVLVIKRSANPVMSEPPSLAEASLSIRTSGRLHLEATRKASMSGKIDQVKIEQVAREEAVSDEL